LTYCCWAQSAFLYNNINLGSQTSLFVCKTAKLKKQENKKISRAAIQELNLFLNCNRFLEDKKKHSLYNQPASRPILKKEYSTLVKEIKKLDLNRKIISYKCKPSRITTQKHTLCRRVHLATT